MTTAKTETTFWMLYVKGDPTPAFMHATIEGARKEAERLAQELHCPVYLLQAIEVCEARDITWTVLGGPSPYALPFRGPSDGEIQTNSAR